MSIVFMNVEEVDFLLLAIGRVPLLDGLGLESIGIQRTPSGHIQVNDKQETTVPGVYCIGDNIGKKDLTPVAIQTGRRLADRLFGGHPESIMDFTNVPTVIFSHPPIGTIGLSEEEARKQYPEETITTYQTTFANTLYFDRSPEDKPKTVMKVSPVSLDHCLVGMQRKEAASSGCPYSRYGRRWDVTRLRSCGEDGRN